MPDLKTLACEVPTLAADQTRQRIQLFPAPGDYVHPIGGEFTLTTDLLAEYADDVNARGDRIALDYDHSPEKGAGTRAAGWFVPGTAEVADDGVYAEVEWTPKAADAIRDREYRFISPTFARGHRAMDGRVVPEPKLVGAAVTNRPFFTVMEPLAADDLSVEDEDAVVASFGEGTWEALQTMPADVARHVITAAVAKQGARVAYADPGYRKDSKPRYPLTSAEDVEAAWKAIRRKQVAATYDRTQLSRIKARIKRAATKLGVTIGADETTKENTMELTEALAADLGVAVDADDETIQAAMTAKLAEKKALETKTGEGVVITADELATLRASAERADENAKKLLENRKTVALDNAVKEFRIAASERDFYAGQFDTNPDGVETFLASKEPIASLTPKGSSASVPFADGEITADLSPVVNAGEELPVDEDRQKVVAATEAALVKAGKDPLTCTADEYAAAALVASKTLGLSL